MRLLKMSEDLESKAFQLLLEAQTCKQFCLWILAIGRRSAYWILEKVLGADFDDHARVGERRVAVAGRHTIDHTTARIATRRDDMSAWTHTERIHATTLHLRYKRIRGIANQLDEFGRWVVVHQAIDKCLRMFDTHTHSETLIREGDTAIEKHLVGVVGGVADGEDGA